MGSFAVWIPYFGLSSLLFLSTSSYQQSIYFLESSSCRIVYESDGALINDASQPSVEYQKQKQLIQKWKLIILEIKTENSRAFNRFEIGVAPKSQKEAEAMFLKNRG